MTIKRDPKGKFQPGFGGRPAGSRNKLQSDFIHALADDFAEHGNAVIRIVRAEEPATYLKVIAGLLPKEFLISENVLEDLSDQDLIDALALIRRQKGEKDTDASTSH